MKEVRTTLIKRKTSFFSKNKHFYLKNQEANKFSRRKSFAISQKNLLNGSHLIVRYIT